MLCIFSKDSSDRSAGLAKVRRTIEGLVLSNQESVFTTTSDEYNG